MSSTKREKILEVRNLKQYFVSGHGRNKMVVKAVDDVSFDIYKGEVFSLVGESGCGKTTTGRTIIKLYPSSGGEVNFHGQRIISDVKAAKAIHRMTLKELKEKLNTNVLNDQEYKNHVQAANELYREAKSDRNFEKQVDPDGRKKRREFNQESPEYKEIVEKYKALDVEAHVNLTRVQNELDTVNPEDKHLIKDLKKQIKGFNREVRLNRLRIRQDVNRYKYTLVYKNRLLMRKMQMIFQDPIASLNPRMTVKEIIAEGLRINGLSNEMEIDRLVKEALTTVGLVAEHASRYPHEFSGGQRQRIGIARALVVEPTFIIADEPISALDVSIRAQVINLLNDLREEKGITILFIAHDLSVVKYFSDRVAVMYYGKIVEIGDKDKIFNHPLHPYTLSLIDSIPLPDPFYEKQRGKSARYNPAAEHDYSVDQPTLREIEEDHFIYCNQVEFEEYQRRIK